MFANVVTVLDAFGIVSLGFSDRYDGRTAGAIGESNQYAAFIVLFLPAMIAAAVASRGLQRLFWLGSALVARMTLVMTASRGGIVGLLCRCAVGACLYRHLVSYSRDRGLGIRRVGPAGDRGELSRITADCWPNACWARLNIDANEPPRDAPRSGSTCSPPWSRIRSLSSPGFGWDVYWSIAFPASRRTTTTSRCGSTSAWSGLVCGTYLLFSGIGRARRASLLAGAAIARPAHRLRARRRRHRHGACSSSTCTTHGIYFWMYAGVVMRLARGATQAGDGAGDERL